MTPRVNPDLIPNAPWWANLMLKFGAFGVIAGLCAAMVFQNRETSTTLLASNLKSVDQLPVIAEKMVAVANGMKQDNAANSEFMKEHTAAAAASRREMDLKLAAIDTRLATVQQELASIRAEQQKTYEIFLKAVEKVMGGEQKNELAPPLPTLNDGGA